MKERFLLTMRTDALSPHSSNRYNVISANYRYAKYPRKSFCIKVRTLDSPRVIQILDYEANSEQIQILKNLLKNNETVFVGFSDIKAMSYRFNNGRSSGIALYSSAFWVIENTEKGEIEL